MTNRVRLAIVGSGPAGLSAGCRAAALGLSHILVERTDHLCDTIFKYQKGKHVMATPSALVLRSDLAFDAGEAGADYVAFGAFFPTATKDVTFRAEPETLAWWHEMMELPSVAIGGINAANCAPLVQAGADFLAVVGAVWNHPEGPAAGVRAMNAAIAAAVTLS